MQWTEHQLEAITARGENLLVAAAAGSGKTAVLVERIIRRITDPENPVGVDRLLVLTFTEAAAGEMRRKIAAALESARQASPDDRHLRNQCMLVHSAQISTIHAFCKTVLQNHIHQTGLPADFTIIDETENEVLRQRALDEVMERYYRRIGKKTGFRELVLGYGGIKNDGRLREMILRLDQFVRSLPYPAQWLRESGTAYRRIASEGSLAGTRWEGALLAYAEETLGDVRDALGEICRLAEAEVPGDHKYAEYFPALYQEFCRCFDPPMSSAEDCRSRLCAFSIPRVPAKTGIDEGTAERISVLRTDGVKKPLDALTALFSGDGGAERMARCTPAVLALKQILRQTQRLHTRYKRERSALDFNDMEHETLRLLGTMERPSPALLDLRERYTEILVDEYQDTNQLQDTLFALLSGGAGNLFMVGDLKQSIYGFRNADPSIFREKYHAYGRGEGGRLIRLFKNFRSRTEVVDTVNDLFSKLMSPACGDVDYTEEEYLIQGARFPDGAGFETELLFTLHEGEEETPEEAEARQIAGRIHAMMRSGFRVTDRETGEYRPLRYGDITLLMRKAKGLADVFENVFRRQGIPVYTEVGEEYLNAVEVQTVLCFLQIIDNPLQDIPLLAVMRSPIFGFTAEELAEIRTRAKGRYYHALCRAAETGEKAAKFLNILNDLRDRAVYTGIDGLIWYIINDLHYSALAGAMPGGGLRRANLKLLFEHGAAFENGTLSGVFDFMQYIETIRNGNGDLTPAKPYADGADVVRIMTVHKSKGLEFPVVFLCGTHTAYNTTELRLPILWQAEQGLALNWQDGEERRKYKTAAHTVTARRKEKEMRSEELRLLYVAMTRASEKLILSCCFSPEKRGASQWQKAVCKPDGRLYPFCVKQGKRFMDWILSACLFHPQAEALRELADRTDIRPAERTGGLILRMNARLAKTEKEWRPETEELAMPEDLLARFAYRYPHPGLSEAPVKLSVSEMKRRQMPEGEYTLRLRGASQAILTDVTEIGAAERGTITHFCLQQIDHRRTDTLAMVTAQLDALAEQGIIQRRQREAVADEDIFAFFASPLGARMKTAEQIYREFDFYLTVPAAEVQEGLSPADGREPVLLQGIADCFFVEAGGIVLLDYKTDGVSAEDAEAAAEKYRIQLGYYARGIEEIMGLPVREKYVYFLHCGRAAEVK